MNKLIRTIASLIVISPALVFSQTIWTDGGADGSWINTLNWTAGVPGTTTAVQFDGASFPDPDPATHIIGVNSGTTVIGSLTIQASTAYSMGFVALGTDTLQVNGALLNFGTNIVDIGLEYTFGSNTLNGPFSFSSLVNTGTQNVSVTDAVSFTNNLYLTLTNNSTYGRYTINALSSINLTGGTVKIDPSSSYAGVNNDVFQLVDKSAGSWSGVNGSTLDVASLPTLTAGLTWNTSNFTTNGSISVVPEPKTWLMLVLGLTVIVVFRRRQKA